MGVFKTADGRSLVGIGQQDGNEYSGFAGWRDCVIQLTASGATEDSVKYLNAIKDYAIAHNAKGESIMPPNLSIWISNNGVTTAVQADDIAVDGANVTICGIKWNGTAWDYTDAGKGGGGGGATSLNDLSDVKITNPAFGQTLVYHESPSPGFINERYDFSDLGGISQNALGAGITTNASNRQHLAHLLHKALSKSLLRLNQLQNPLGKPGQKCQWLMLWGLFRRSSQFKIQKSVFPLQSLETMSFSRKAEFRPRNSCSPLPIPTVMGFMTSFLPLMQMQALSMLPSNTPPVPQCHKLAVCNLLLPDCPSRGRLGQDRGGRRVCLRVFSHSMS